MPAPEDTIEELVRAMNAAWLEGRIEDLRDYFADDVVLVPPGSGDRLIGREDVMESFRQYLEQAVTHEFEERSLAVDVIGSTAVARLRFRVRYEYAGSVYEEQGQDILVLAESGECWRIVWRTQLPEEVPGGDV